VALGQPFPEIAASLIGSTVEPVRRSIRNRLRSAVIVLGVVGQEHPKTVTDRDAGGDDEERVGEPAVFRVGDLVHDVPGDEHGHETVLPEPVAIFIATRLSPGFDDSLASRSRFSIQTHLSRREILVSSYRPR
jgi:hypothetical protein